MSIPQYRRKVSLVVGAADGNALDLSELRFRFATRRGDTQTPNSADIRVYNVSDETANRIRQRLPQPEFTRLVLQAGYEGNCGVIFDGTIMQVRRGRESQTDTYLDITAADGDSAYNFATMAVSLAAGTKPGDHVAAVLGRMADHGISNGYIPESLKGNALPRGKVMYGMCKDELREIARNTNTNWSIQDGRLQMVTDGAYMPGDVPVITAATGMIGMPEQAQNGIRVKMLLNPNVRIGGRIKLDNKSIQQYRYGLGLTEGALQSNFQVYDAVRTTDDGIYCVMVSEHSGDTLGDDWYTSVICLSADSMYPESFKSRVAVPAPGESATTLFGG